MATFGQGVNPQLGAINYSPILQGSVAGAQMAAQGGSMIGQGLANLGQEVGKGVETYFKKQDMMKAQIGEIKGWAETDPTYAATIPPKFLESAAAGNLKPREVTELYAHGAMIRKARNEKIQNDLIIAHTAAYNAAANDEASKKSLANDQKDALDLVGSTLASGGKALNLTGVAPRVAAIAQGEWNSRYGDKVKVDETVKQYKKQDEAGGKRLQSFLKPETLDVEGHKFLKTVDANGEDTFIPLNETEAAQREVKQKRLGSLLDTIADAEGRNDLEGSSRARLQVLAEYPGLAQTPSELNRILKPFIAGRARNINERPPAGVTNPDYRNPNFNVESISRIAPSAAELPAYRNGVMVQPTAVQPTQMPVAAQSTQSVVNENSQNSPSSFAAPTGGTIQSLQSQQATSAQLPNRPNIQQAGEGSSPQPTPASNPYSSNYDQGYGDDRGGAPSSLGASSVTPSSASAKASAPSAQVANLTAGAAKTVSSVLDSADQIYIGAEAVNAVFNDPKLRTEVKDLVKKASGKLEFLSKYLGSKTSTVLGAGKEVLGKVARPAMIVNSADKIIGKYVAKDFPDVDHQRVSSAVMENVAVWFDSQNKTTKDETMALLAQKSKYLMGSNMSREAKLAKNAELLKLMAAMQLRSSTVYPERYIQLGQ